MPHYFLKRRRFIGGVFNDAADDWLRPRVVRRPKAAFISRRGRYAVLAGLVCLGLTMGSGYHFYRASPDPSAQPPQGGQSFVLHNFKPQTMIELMQIFAAQDAGVYQIRLPFNLPAATLTKQGQRVQIAGQMESGLSYRRSRSQINGDILYDENGTCRLNAMISQPQITFKTFEGKRNAAELQIQSDGCTPEHFTVTAKGGSGVWVTQGQQQGLSALSWDLKTSSNTPAQIRFRTRLPRFPAIDASASLVWEEGGLIKGKLFLTANRPGAFGQMAQYWPGFETATQIDLEYEEGHAQITIKAQDAVIASGTAKAAITPFDIQLNDIVFDLKGGEKAGLYDGRGHLTMAVDALSYLWMSGELSSGRAELQLSDALLPNGVRVAGRAVLPANQMVLSAQKQGSKATVRADIVKTAPYIRLDTAFIESKTGQIRLQPSSIGNRKDAVIVIKDVMLNRLPDNLISQSPITLSGVVDMQGNGTLHSAGGNRFVIGGGVDDVIPPTELQAAYMNIALSPYAKPDVQVKGQVALQGTQTPVEMRLPVAELPKDLSANIQLLQEIWTAWPVR